MVVVAFAPGATVLLDDVVLIVLVASVVLELTAGFSVVVVLDVSVVLQNALKPWWISVGR